MYQIQPKNKNNDNYTRCKNSAIYSLAMREHSRKEIQIKLKRKDFSEGVDLEILLDELEHNDYLNEYRFTENFIRYRASKGQGALRIMSELINKGISKQIINKMIYESEIDWFDLAAKQLEKKFGLELVMDYKEKARRMRFLLTRGFTQEIVQEIVN